MAFDAFLKIDTIPGESTDEKHKDWISILSYTHSVSQAGSGSRSDAGGGAAGRVDHSSLNVVKSLDKASPKIMVAVCTGEHIKEVRIALSRAAKDKQKFYEIVLSDVLITACRPVGNPTGETSLPTEEVSFSYGKIEWVYTETDHATGKAKGDIKAKWDLIGNKGG
jgi:type VI secretion system secreted protein Hcp